MNLGRLIVYMPLLASFGLSGCSNTLSSFTKEDKGPLELEQALARRDVTEDAKKKSAAAHQKIASQFKFYPDDHPGTVRVKQMVDRIVKHTFKPEMELEVKIVQDNNVNAFVTGADYVYVNNGLMSFVQSDDELAFVLAHEISHIDAAHIDRAGNNSVSMLCRTGGILSEILSKIQTKDDPKAQAAAAEKEVSDTEKYLTLLCDGYIAQYSQQHETEADALGFRAATLAGYDAAKGAEFFYRTANLRDAQETNSQTKDASNIKDDMMKSFLSSHPMDEERIQTINRLKEYYTTYNLPGKNTSITSFFQGDKALEVVEATERVEQAREVEARKQRKLAKVKDCGANNLKKVQDALNKMGFSCGTADGYWGQNTANCVTEYQRSRDINASGRVDSATCERLAADGVRF